MLKEKVAYVFCGPRESFRQSTNESVVMPECLARSVMSLYEGVKARVREDSESSEELGVNVRTYDGSVMAP